MNTYRTPLPGILAAMLESAVNRLLSMDEGSPERLDRLEGRMLELHIEGIGITLFFAFNGGRVEVGTQSSFEPDTVISGSPVALFAMAAPDDISSWTSPDSRVQISGDANLARDLERLFSQLEPDWEGRLSRIFGDVWGHQVAAGIRAGAGQARESAGQAGEMLSEYLQQNRSPVVSKDEVEALGEAIEEAGEWAEDLEARIRERERSD